MMNLLVTGKSEDSLELFYVNISKHLETPGKTEYEYNGMPLVRNKHTYIKYIWLFLKDQDTFLIEHCRTLPLPVLKMKSYKCFNNFQIATKELRTFIELIGEISLYEVLNELRINHFYDDRGLIVHPQFRKLGIATEFLKARYVKEVSLIINECTI
jgi:hypothetical protein